MAFDLEDHKIRQYRIWSIILGSWLTTVISGVVIRYGNITDENTQVVIAFLGLTAAMVFVFGLYTSFVAWFEKKLFQRIDKINNE